jgi:hypothetical protein
MLAGEASLGFGRASHVTHQGFSVGAYRRAFRAAVKPAAFAPEILGHEHDPEKWAPVFRKDHA